MRPFTRFLVILLAHQTAKLKTHEFSEINMADYRMMTAMVLFKFEQELGAYVHQRSPKIEESIKDIATGILERDTKGRSDFSEIGTSQLIAETYIEDLFQLALRLTKNTADFDLLNQLRSLAASLNIYEIRNSVAHPNRPFPDCYWFRMAAIVTDPLVQQLNFKGLSGCLDAAMSGRLEIPPEDWLKQPEWLIPNDLPKNSDFDITGLIGRPRETGELQKYLLNPRINTVAIVAPGGVGKTALALDVLSRACKTPEFAQHFQAIAFATLKLEKLTTAGITKLNAPDSIQALEAQLSESLPSLFGEEPFNSFLEMKQRLADSSLLLFIDNLETLLLDDPSDFNDFQINLPPKWRLLLTSRVPINSATCLVLPPLTEASAKHLTRVYSTRRGASGVFSDEVVERVIARTRCNPLAVRLVVDAYILGSTLDDSIDCAAKDVLSFSYRILLDTLSQDSCAVLECLVLQDLQTRMELAENINCSIDVVANGLAELSRTSLIVRDQSGERERYSLYPAVRDVLLVQPRDPNLRKLIHHRLLSIKEALAEDQSRQSKLTKHHPDFVETELPSVVRNCCFETNRALKQSANRRRESILDLIERLRQLKLEYPKVSAIPRQLGKVFKALGDNGTAIVEMREALTIDPENIQLLMLLARYLHDDRNYLGAIDLYSKVRDLGGWNKDVVEISIARYAYNGYLLALMYARDNQRILNETNDWQNLDFLSDLAGAFRARAWKRSIETTGDGDVRAKALNKASLILEDLHKTFGYTAWVPGFFQEIIRGIVDLFKITGITSNKYASKLLIFVDQHMTSVFADTGDDFESVLSIVGILSKINLAENPFRTQDWADFLRTNGGHSFANEEERLTLVRDGYTIASIYHKPTPESAFAFAKDHNGTQYFVHFQSMHPDYRHLWRRVVEGADIALKPDLRPTMDGKAVQAFECIVI